jgi:hypothetical protein
VTYGGDSGNRIFVLYWRCPLIRGYTLIDEAGKTDKAEVCLLGVDGRVELLRVTSVPVRPSLHTSKTWCYSSKILLLILRWKRAAWNFNACVTLWSCFNVVCIGYSCTRSASFVLVRHVQATSLNEMGKILRTVNRNGVWCVGFLSIIACVSLVSRTPL